MSPYAKYVKEREGNLVLEESWGFIEFKLSPPVCSIISIYVDEENRLKGKGSELANSVTQIAKDAGCSVLWSQVWTGALNATDSLKAILGYGFTVQRAENGVIILTKDIGGL